MSDGEANTGYRGAVSERSASNFFTWGALSALVAVAAGAFGAHGLEGRVSPARLGTWQTAAHYQAIHALALLAVAWATTRWPGRLTAAAGWLFLAGTLLFSGSLYLLVLADASWLGAVTPLGGVSFLAGWACLAVASARD
jgi:uncharacterized membrane protein YgdD (TMEM256/DUF423 family)